MVPLAHPQESLLQISYWVFMGLQCSHILQRWAVTVKTTFQDLGLEIAYHFCCCRLRALMFLKTACHGRSFYEPDANVLFFNKIPNSTSTSSSWMLFFLTTIVYCRSRLPFIALWLGIEVGFLLPLKHFSVSFPWIFSFQFNIAVVLFSLKKFCLLDHFRLCCTELVPE